MDTIHNNDISVFKQVSVERVLTVFKFKEGHHFVWCWVG